MMLQSSNDTYYDESFYSVVDGHIINNATGASLGKVVRKIEVTNYLCRPKEPTLLQKLIKWFGGQQTDWDKIERSRITKEGPLVETMRSLPKEKK